MLDPSDLGIAPLIHSFPRLALIVVAVTFFAFGPPPALAQQGGGHRLTILHTNDLHGHVTPWKGWEGELAGRTVGGAARLAGAIDQVRKEVGSENVLVIDAGDALGDTMLARLTKGSVVFDVLNAAGYHAMTIGNHDVDFTMDGLRTLMDRATFEVVAVNVKEGERLFARPFTLIQRAGVLVGIVGLAYPNTAMTTSSKNLGGVTFQHDPEGVQEAVREARKQGAAVVIVLSHGGLQADQKLASMVEGVDVIVGGHSHNPVKEVIRAGSALLVSAGAHGSHLGRLDLRIQDRKVVEHERSLIALDAATVPPDRKMAALVEEAARPFRKQIDEVVGEARETIARAETIGDEKPGPREQLSPADVLFANILRERAGADVALLPGVGYGVAIPPGPITAAALRNLIPHDSRMVTLSLTGQQIREILEQAVHNVYTTSMREKVGGMIQVSGLRFEYDPSREKGSRVLGVEIGGKPIDEAATYKAVTNSMAAAGGHNYKTFQAASDRQEGPEVYEVVKAWLGKAGPVSAPAVEAIRKRVGGK